MKNQLVFAVEHRTGLKEPDYVLTVSYNRSKPWVVHQWFKKPSIVEVSEALTIAQRAIICFRTMFQEQLWSIVGPDSIINPDLNEFS